MPNYCNYSMRVLGNNKENLEEFIKVMQANYNYHDMEFEFDRHMGARVFEADYDEIEETSDGMYAVTIDGYCAWSVYSCMLDGYHTYYNDLYNKYKDECRSTTVPIESKRLALDIEIFSDESGMDFMEHYVVKKGTVEIDDCVEYESFYIGEYETKEEAEKDLEQTFTDEEWDNAEDGCRIVRGGIEWDFKI